MDIRKENNLRRSKNGRIYSYVSPRGAKEAIEEKIAVLKEFYIVDKNNEDAVRAAMKAEIERRSDVDFDRVLDSFAKKLIGEKLG